MKSYLVNHASWELTSGEEMIRPKKASARKKWTMKGALALFATNMSVDDYMLYHLMKVKTTKEAWDIFDP